MTKVLVLGATGRAGQRVSEELLAAGVEVVLAGRDGMRVRELAQRLDVPGEATRVVDVQDEQAVAAAVAGVDAVVNAVGPFMVLAAPVIEVCLRARVPLVDLANEQPAVQALLGRDAAAREAGVVLVTGAGLGLVATEYLAMQMAAQSPAPPRAVRSVLMTWNSASSAGVKASAAAAMQVGSTRYVNGELVHAPIGADLWQTQLTGRLRTLVAAPLGDVEAVRRASGANDVAAYVEAPPGAGVDGQEARSTAYVEFTDEQGGTRAESLELGDSLVITARIAVRTVLGVLEAGRPGAWTPGALLGADSFRDVLTA
ncbi:saccharopine dehydrogenase NADP-binding domain-containing protein [Kineococcus sp. R86509]|uniref:saccharopine dehydrogenase NADP-binding domain-containing protein n=1 Tax=Kineococcus sp. R86509 TaxID=3093851 RepID=UPI0036D233B1